MFQCCRGVMMVELLKAILKEVNNFIGGGGKPEGPQGLKLAVSLLIQLQNLDLSCY